MADIKPIETVYNGYRFRSRLEARWAVFFDTLGIKYRYEYDGFSLPDGTRYLPDFWLSEHNCWMEIKGEKPLDSAWHKINQLAIGTGHNAYIAWGDCWLPSEGGAKISGQQGVNVVARHSNHGRKIEPLGIQSDIILHDMPRDLVVMIHQLFLYGITLSLSRKRKKTGHGNGLYVATDEWFSGATFDQALEDIEKQHKELKRIFSILTKRHEELFNLIPSIPPFKGDSCTFLIDGGGTIVSAEWRIAINGKPELRDDDPFIQIDYDEYIQYKITEAYTAARQARFEHGVKYGKSK